MTGGIIAVSPALVSTNGGAPASGPELGVSVGINQRIVGLLSTAGARGITRRSLLRLDSDAEGPCCVGEMGGRLILPLHCGAQIERD